MKRITAKACLLMATAAALGIPLESAAQSKSFFPSRPEQGSFYSAVGTLGDYGIGQKSGIVVLNTPLGIQHEFYAGYPMKINGKPVTCPIPPHPGVAQDPTICKDWPSNVVIGKTKVRVTFWRVKVANGEVNVTDQIDTLP